MKKNIKWILITVMIIAAFAITIKFNRLSILSVLTVFVIFIVTIELFLRRMGNPLIVLLLFVICYFLLALTFTFFYWDLSTNSEISEFVFDKSIESRIYARDINNRLKYKSSEETIKRIIENEDYQVRRFNFGNYSLIPMYISGDSIVLIETDREMIVSNNSLSHDWYEFYLDQLNNRRVDVISSEYIGESVVDNSKKLFLYKIRMFNCTNNLDAIKYLITINKDTLKYDLIDSCFILSSIKYNKKYNDGKYFIYFDEFEINEEVPNFYNIVRNSFSYLDTSVITVIRDVETKRSYHFIDYLYFSFVTITSTGYGDIYPNSSFTRLLTLLESFLGILLITIYAGLFGRQFTIKR